MSLLRKMFWEDMVDFGLNASFINCGIDLPMILKWRNLVNVNTPRMKT